MTSGETRRAFLDFFSARDHRVVPSSPLVLPADPTLLFVNAGMNQFKDVFTGRQKADFPRAASSQKCLRVSGKHNDLEQVGRTPRHHTFFEMLGNFSFGDYFKDDAVAYAWELITEVFGLPEDRLWVTVFGGSESVGPDEDALAVWRDRIGVPVDRILRLGEKDNFWRMGETGPCGPCSEIHFDLGADLTSVEGESNPGTDERRYIEIWNLVFMEYDQKPDGSLARLPRPSIDTGMGLERIAAVLQDRRSNYDTDLFRPILKAASDRAGVAYGNDADADFSLRVIADHARALCFLVADGVVPANDKRGYVLRRVLRRAIRHGGKLGMEGPFLHEVTPVVVEHLGEAYPELLAAQDAILEVGRREEERFQETVTAGLTLLDKALADSRDGGSLPGKELFRLYDTFGLPLDLASDVAEERGVGLDMEGFEAELAQQRERARASFKGGRATGTGEDWSGLGADSPTRFVGYETTRREGRGVLAVRTQDGEDGPLVAGAQGVILLDETPFYGEAGGQVGDTGWIVSASARARVVDTLRAGGGLVVHRVAVEDGEIRPGDTVAAEVDEARRNAIRRNHTATHLLHAALREVLGTHVKQAGSLVAPDRLRFDFSHFSPVSERALADIESLVNRRVLEDIEVADESKDLDEAIRDGAMALFGEKYGERVRVVTIGEFSKELCGGTHCGRSGEIGLFKLTLERGIASGTRRVEAVTGEGSLERFRESQALVRSLEELLSVPSGEIVPELTRRLDQLRSVQRKADELRLRSVQDDLVRRAGEARPVRGVKLVVERVDAISAKDMRVLADRLRQTLGSGVVILGRAEGARASLLVAVTKDLADRFPAGEIVGELAKIIGGRGGGRRDMAEAGGKDASRLDDALARGREGVEQRAGASG